MKLTFSPRAALDLEEIGDYIARDNPKRASSFLEELEAQCYRVAEMPSAFPKRDDLFYYSEASGIYLDYFAISSSCSNLLYSYRK